MALVATLLSTSLAVRQADTASETVIYLALGALIGVAYSLGTEKFIRAMQHRHIFVRNAMLWLSAVAWLFAAAAVAWVASLIYNQAGGSLEGFDRILGVLIPFVVRADLIVDWAKRVAWALLNMASWTQSAVQMRRLISRASNMKAVVSVNDEVISMAHASHDRQRDLVVSEDRIWTEDADSLVHVSEVLQHFEKLGRVAIYAFGGLVGAIPGAIIWILYALFHGFVSFHNSLYVLGTLYWISIILAPFGAIILIIASTGLLCGVVTLSIVGTVIQFSVYWSTRTVYSMVRIALSQAWAGFPDIKKPNAMPNVQQSPLGPNAGLMAVRAVRHPEEAGAAIAQMGAFLPSDLEFALASWDGKHKDDLSKPIGFSVSRHFMSFRCFRCCFGDNALAASQGKATLSSQAIKTSSQDMGGIREHSSSDVEDGLEGADVPGGMVLSTASVLEDPDIECSQVIKDNETVLILLGRMGLDLRVKSARKRRLSTYYALGMLVHLQVESGGNAWRMHTILELSDAEFDHRIAKFNCIIAEEAKVAIQELISRLRGSSKYRILPTGTPNSNMVPVHVWLRSALLTFLETPSESDGSRGLRHIGLS